MYSYETTSYENAAYHPEYAVGFQPYTSPKGAFAPNGFGLYDMSGNIEEWGFEWYPHYEGQYRQAWGGSWLTFADACRIQLSLLIAPGHGLSNAGFRTVLPLSEVETRIARLEGDLQFGEVPLGQSLSRIVTVHNDGNQPLRVDGYSVPRSFTLSNGWWTGQLLPPGGSMEVTVTFAPTDAQTYDGFIGFSSNATSGDFQIECSGEGVPASNNTEYLHK